MMKDAVIAYIKDAYGVLEEHPWERDLLSGVFRHRDNQKWFALSMAVSRQYLGLKGEGTVDILNVKVPDPFLRDALLTQEGYLPAYHMNKRNWITMLLDGSLPLPAIQERIDESFGATASTKTRQAYRGPKDWIIPANPKYYDVQAAFEKETVISWKQGAGIRVGDTVFMYVAAPVQAVLYQCEVLETHIPFAGYEGEVNIKELMTIRLVTRYDPERFTMEVLKRDYGIYAVRGPRGIPVSLSEEFRR